MNPLEKTQSPYSLAGPAESTADFFAKVYRWMALGLAVTGVVALAIANSPEAFYVVRSNPAIFMVLLFAQLGLVVALSAAAHRVSSAAAAAMYLGYAVLTGVTFSVLFVVYTRSSIAEVFFITAGSFAGLSLYGGVTKRDLSALGQFMFVGLVGLVLASLVNIFFKNPAIYWITTYAGVLIFAGLTAYDTQKLKAMHAAHGDVGNLALRGALTLYLDFINMFLFLLRLFGRRR